MVYLIPGSYTITVEYMLHCPDCSIQNTHYIVDCGPPPVFLNGTVSYQNMTEGSEAHYRCDDGFTLEGEMTAVEQIEDGAFLQPAHHLQVLPSILLMIFLC